MPFMQEMFQSDRYRAPYAVPFSSSSATSIRLKFARARCSRDLTLATVDSVARAISSNVKSSYSARMIASLCNGASA